MSSFEVTPEQITQWREREEKRMWDGTYKPVPQEVIDLVPFNPDHYVHMSEKSKGSLAYTANDMAGVNDRQKIISLRSYVQKYFPDWIMKYPGKIVEAERALMPREHRVQLFSSAEDIVRVYTRGPGFDSCMRHSVEYFGLKEHPCAVYGDSDIQLAVLVDNDLYPEGKEPCLVDMERAVLGRALVWPDRKYRGRIYSSYHADAFAAELRALGYTKRDLFIGARVREVYDGSYTVMPYLDVGEYLDDTGEGYYRIVDGCGTYSARSADGRVEEAEDDRSCCEHCEERADDDEIYNVRTSYTTEQYWCESCRRSDAFYCEGHSRYFCDANYASYEVDGRIYSEDYCADNFKWCEYNDEYTSDGTVEVHVQVTATLWNEDWTISTKTYRWDTQDWARSVAQEKAVQCEYTDDWYDAEIATLYPVTDADGNEVMVPDVAMHKHDIYLVNGYFYFGDALPAELFSPMLLAAE